ncbi:GlxA family transcriptional regulator [Candidatus Spongiihabitans sp.]|uniref:GlxA family transcriptional regulator n=1 Tax=Candidatus Spongiihabitans sp. TaxID=3101308 RepID=UPI003C6FE98C
MNRAQYGAITEGAEREIGFYLSDNFSMLPFISAVEPLRIANRMSRKPLYQWSIVTENGDSVFATNGMELAAKYAVKNAPDFSMIFVNGPHEPKNFNHRPTLNWLAGQSKRGIVIGGIETGCHILAESGLLDGIQCTTHWENQVEFVEAFPKHKVSSDVYEIDGNRVTCSGGAVSMDMMLYIIEQHHGHELAASVADVMIHPNICHPGEPQRMNVQARTGVSHPALLECIELMEANIEQPLSPNELARLVEISKRQLERLFRRYLNTTPARYYLNMRLDAARKMLETSAMKIIDVTVACGFKSAGHFSSRSYSSYGVTPRDSRKI